MKKLMRRLFLVFLLLFARPLTADFPADGVPFYFAIPDSANLPFPDAASAPKFTQVRVPGFESSPVGLRLIRVKAERAERRELSRKLVAQGALKDGDVLLTFHPEWARTSPYQHFQLGISHSGIVFTEDGVAHNLDMPLDEIFNGPTVESAFDSSHYMETKAVHVLRPRQFNETRAANLRAWVRLIRANIQRIRDERLLPFNVSYTAPKIAVDPDLKFLATFSSIIKGQSAKGTTLNMFCSEFGWSMLTLSACAPSEVGTEPPACAEKILEPMNIFSRNLDASPTLRTAGLIEGPLMILELLKATPDEKEKLLAELFSMGPVQKASFGHQLAAGQVKGLIDLAKPYYIARIRGEKQFEITKADGTKTTQTHAELASKVRLIQKPNYSPGAFLINSFLPTENKNRAFDYVGTLYFD